MTRIKKIKDTFLTNPDISAGAKGMFFLINQKPLSWRSNPELLKAEVKNSWDEINDFLEELKQHGYLQRIIYDGDMEQYELNMETTRKKKMELLAEIQKVVNYWNAQEITKHSKITPSMEVKIIKALEIYGMDDTMTGILNYATVQKSKYTWWDHKWTLEEFLSRDKGLAVFIYKTEKDYLDREAVKKNPAARALAQEVHMEKSKKEVTDREEQLRVTEEEKKEAMKARAEIIKYFDSLPTEAKEDIDWNTNVYMQIRYENLQYNLPKVFEDYRKQTKLQETVKYRNNPTLYVRNERPDKETPESEGVQGG